MWWILGGIIVMGIILYLIVRGGTMRDNDWENYEDDREGN